MNTGREYWKRERGNFRKCAFGPDLIIKLQLLFDYSTGAIPKHN
jgi:hypothetical protein